MPSKVEDLCLGGSATDHINMNRLLEGINALWTFSYRNDLEPTRLTDRPRTCLDTLMLHSSGSLESMIFIIESDIQIAKHEDAARAISLRGYTVLKYVALTCSFFIVLKGTARIRVRCRSYFHVLR